MNPHYRLTCFLILTLGLIPAKAQDPSPSSKAPRKANRLAQEKSPYLLQHQFNPVDWYPWGPEAFERARKEDKPVLLSIGYSTCYWCHVMERESFENEAIAALLNRDFICIKVDREERPDVDKVYMNAYQALAGGGGGWPLNMFLTPEGKPFFGGTYIPPTTTRGRRGMTDLLPLIVRAWKDPKQREKILTDARRLTAHLQQRTVPKPGTLTPKTLETAYNQFAKIFDPKHGGFGNAPKFPRPHSMMFLLRYARRANDSKALDMVQTSLDPMARGGIYDHLGYGFHRYSTDSRWLVPHFEKMLYDNALLVLLHLEAFQITGRPFHERIARETLQYISRELTSPEGPFYSAEDAESLPPGEASDGHKKEGAYYLWRPEEVIALLGEVQGKLFCEIYDVTEAGNFTDPHDQLAKKKNSILHLEQHIDQQARKRNIPPDKLIQQIETCRQKLFAARSKRPRPHLDDKVLAAWNGLAIAAFARAHQVLGDPEYRLRAETAARFLQTTMTREGRLLRRYRDGEAALPGYLNDYAFLAWGLLELYQATFEPAWLEGSKKLLTEMNRLFWDDKSGGFNFSGRDGEALIATTKEIYDGALPSGNSCAAYTLLRVGHLTGDSKLFERGEKTLETFATTIDQYPMGYPFMLLALDFLHGRRQEIVISGSPDDPATQKLVSLVRRRFLPHTLTILHPPGTAGKAIRKLVPFVAGQTMIEDRPTAYLCRDYACQAPTTDPKVFEKLLER